jgi:hypothetical protein
METPEMNPEAHLKNGASISIQPLSLTLTLSRWERESLRMRLIDRRPSAFRRAGYRTPSPSGRDL